MFVPGERPLEQPAGGEHSGATGGIWEWTTPYDAAAREEWYDGMEKAFRLKNIQRYAVATEVWIGGAANPNRQEGFLIACADRTGNTLGLRFLIDRAGPHAQLIRHGGLMTKCCGDLYTMLQRA